LLVGVECARHSNKCTTINKSCQDVFLWYGIFVMNNTLGTIAFWLIIFAIPVSVTLNMPCEPEQAPPNVQGNTALSGPSSIGAQDNQPTSKDLKRSTYSTPCWHATVKRAILTGLTSSEWWLVFIAGATGLAIVLQVREMKLATNEMKASTIAATRSAEVAEKSIVLQETALHQWVDLEEWKVERWSGVSKCLAVVVDVTNKTDFCLDLGQITIRHETGSITAKDVVRLTPGGRYRQSGFAYPLTDMDDSKYLESGLVIPIVVVVNFTDIIGRGQVQEFKGLLTCNKQEVSFVLTNFGSESLGGKRPEIWEDPPDQAKGR